MLINRIPCNASNLQIDPFGSIRIKLTDRCNFDCSFCHHEGALYAKDLELNSFLLLSLKQMKRDLRLSEVHLTGGEPTLYKDLLRLIGDLKSMGFDIKMTTNGQFDKGLLSKLKLAGLNGLNFSIHTLIPDALAKMQKKSMSPEWGKNAIKKQLMNLSESKSIGINTKINTVYHDGSDIGQLLHLIEICRMHDVGLRVLNDLNPLSNSTENIVGVLSALGGSIEDVKVAEHTSGFSYGIRLKDDFLFRVKDIRRVPLNSMCSYCEVRDSCKEWFYGIRIEQKLGRPIVRLCLHRQEYPSVQNISEFFTSLQYEELKRYAKS